MACAHVTIPRCLLVTATCCVIAIGSLAVAGETTQSPRPHSLIHRQNQEATASDPSAPTTAPTAESTPTPHPRKLTKRPTQPPVAAPSSGAITSQVTASSSKPVSPVQTNTTRSESRMSMAPTGPAQFGASSPSTAVTTSAGTASATSSAAATPSSSKTPVAMAVPGMGPGRAVSQRAVAGRGLQSLSAQMPALTHLVAPTVAVSSAPSSSQPPSSSFSTQSGQSPSAPNTGNAILTWSLNSETDLAGYKIYVGTASGLYNFPGSPFVVGATSSYMVTGLPAGQTYYFAISAFDTSGSESGMSTEVSKSIY
jgi:hypothetical protein